MTFVKTKKSGSDPCRGLASPRSSHLNSQQEPAIKLLIVDDDPSICSVLSRLFTAEGLCVNSASTGATALAALSRETFDVVLLDLNMPDIDGFAVLRSFRDELKSPATIVHSGHLNVRLVAKAMQDGAVDVFEKPCQSRELLERVRIAAHERKQKESILPPQSVSPTGPLARLIGGSASMKDLRRQIECVAAFPTVSVLIDGPTGTGKELVSRSIHESTCPNKPFVSVNCAAIPENLLESELFGHAPGAFTDAKGARIGLLEEAGCGTLFLDEVGEMPHALQTKLLRVLETGEFRRVGDNRTRYLKARIVSATNQNLSPRDNCALRSDLYFRLAGYTIRTPELATRNEDIAELTRHFVDDFCARHSLPAYSITAGAISALEEYDWPGNVRELRRCIENITMLCKNGRIDEEGVNEVLQWRTNEDFPSGNFPISTTKLTIKPPSGTRRTAASLPELERDHILAAYEAANRNLSQAARSLGIARSTLRERLKKYASGE